LFKMECYRWLPRHWKWGKIYTYGRVRQVLVTKLRKHRHYEMKKRKVPCMCFVFGFAEVAPAPIGTPDGQAAADKQKEK